MKQVILLALIFLVLYPWFIYPMILWVMKSFIRRTDTKTEVVPCSITVIIAAHNEGKRIAERIQNILQCDLPKGKLDVLVVSDGSTDGTREIVEKMGYPEVTAFDNTGVRGRAGAHNEAVRRARGEILLFTDADTHFGKNFITKVEKAFSDPEVGLVSGTLHYRNQDATDLTRSASLYWRFELWLRALESRLGLFAFASGACVAVRKELYRDIPPTGDVDFTTPLDVVLQGCHCVHLTDAVAVDEMPQNPAGEFKARVRMTAKNLHGTFQRWGWENWFIHPFYSWVVLSHKVLRWLTPVFLILLFGTTLYSWVMGPEDRFVGFILAGQLAFYVGGLLGALAQRLGYALPVATQIYNFLFANAGFLVGIWKIISNSVPSAYKSYKV